LIQNEFWKETESEHNHEPIRIKLKAERYEERDSQELETDFLLLGIDSEEETKAQTLKLTKETSVDMREMKKKIPRKPSEEVISKLSGL